MYFNNKDCGVSSFYILSGERSEIYNLSLEGDLKEERVSASTRSGYNEILLVNMNRKIHDSNMSSQKRDAHEFSHFSDSRSRK